MRLAVLAVVCLTLAARTGHADDTKSPGWALGLPIGATVGGVLLVGAMAGDSEAPPELLVPAIGLAVTGPSWGHIYTHDYDLAIGGTLLRVLGVAMYAEGRGDCVPDPDDLDGACIDYENDTPALMYAGVALVVGTALAEMIDAPFAAKRYNREHAVTIAPVVTKDQVGAMLVGRF